MSIYYTYIYLIRSDINLFSSVYTYNKTNSSWSYFATISARNWYSRLYPLTPLLLMAITHNIKIHIQISCARMEQIFIKFPLDYMANTNIISLKNQEDDPLVLLQFVTLYPLYPSHLSINYKLTDTTCTQYLWELCQVLQYLQ